jgi:hypothetical protein
MGGEVVDVVDVAKEDGSSAVKPKEDSAGRTRL